jgi:ABC-type oligopeptide transport system ATPase subunit
LSYDPTMAGRAERRGPWRWEGSSGRASTHSELDNWQHPYGETTAEAKPKEKGKPKEKEPKDKAKEKEPKEKEPKDKAKEKEPKEMPRGKAKAKLLLLVPNFRRWTLSP